MKITDRQMVIDYLTSAALVSSMKEIADKADKWPACRKKSWSY